MKKTETAVMVSRALKSRCLKIYMLRDMSVAKYRGSVFLVIETSKQKARQYLIHVLANDPKLSCFSEPTQLTCECLGLAKTGLPAGLVESALDRLYFIMSDN